MTDTVQLALIACIPPTMTALAGLYVSIRNGGKSDVIAAHVNSAATASVAKIDALQQELQQLRSAMAVDKQREALLAQSAAVSMSSGRAAEHGLGVAPAAKSLDQIDKNTAAIDANTKRTDQTVQELKDKP